MVGYTKVKKPGKKTWADVEFATAEEKVAAQGRLAAYATEHGLALTLEDKVPLLGRFYTSTPLP